MVPVNATVGALSAHISDRSMVFGSLALCTLCLLALTASTASAAVFFGGGVMLFVGSVVLEGTATSLMSKCIWRGCAQGVLNAGGGLSVMPLLPPPPLLPPLPPPPLPPLPPPSSSCCACPAVRLGVPSIA
jgi:hypothetical protein